MKIKIFKVHIEYNMFLTDCNGITRKDIDLSHDARLQDDDMTLTSNGALAYAETGSARLDFFSNITARQEESATPIDVINECLSKAWEESPLDTLKLIAYTRDCRGGKGERRLTEMAQQWLADNHPKQMKTNQLQMIEYGYWKDLLMTWTGTQWQSFAMDLMANQLRIDLGILRAAECEEDDTIARKLLGTLSLAAKYAPTEGCTHDRRSRHRCFRVDGQKIKNPSTMLAYKLIENASNMHYGNVMKLYRTTFITPLREALNIVEKLMCAKQWDIVADQLSNVPSRALARYARRCFPERLGDRFRQWQQDVLSGKKKANVGQVDPYEVVTRMAAYVAPEWSMQNLSVDIAELPMLEAFYKLQVEKMRKSGTLNAISLIDVSGSMSGTPMMVAISMGIWISSIASPAFRDVAITFTHQPEIIDMTKCNSLQDRINVLKNAPAGLSTNLQAAFDLILTRATDGHIPATEMPTTLFIITDMQFDNCDSNIFTTNDTQYRAGWEYECGDYGCDCHKITNFELIKAKFRDAGYVLPNIVYWNVNGTTSGSPVKMDERGVCLVSGWSKDILNLFLDGIIPSPYEMMRKAIDNPRYDPIILSDD